MNPRRKIYYLFVTFNRLAVRNKKLLTKGLGILLTILSLVSALPLFSDNWRPIFIAYVIKFGDTLPGFFEYFLDPRALFLYIIGVYFLMERIYHRYEIRFLLLTLKSKKEIAEALPSIKGSCPANHYLGLILGQLNEKALEVKNRRGIDIISTIDKNIKKYERVYWVSENEIGIIFYEIKTKDENDFLNFVVKNKLKNEIQDDATLFLDNIQFHMYKIEGAEELDSIESKTRTELLIKLKNKEAELKLAADKAASVLN